MTIDQQQQSASSDVGVKRRPRVRRHRPRSNRITASQARSSRASPTCSGSVPSRIAQQQQSESSDVRVKRQPCVQRYHPRSNRIAVDQARRTQARPTCSGSVPSRIERQQQSASSDVGVKRRPRVRRCRPRSNSIMPPVCRTRTGQISPSMRDLPTACRACRGHEGTDTQPFRLRAALCDSSRRRARGPPATAACSGPHRSDAESRSVYRSN